MTVGPGWHPDPYGLSSLRWWDGGGWTAWVVAPGLAPWTDSAVVSPAGPGPEPAAPPPAPTPPAEPAGAGAPAAQERSAGIPLHPSPPSPSRVRSETSSPTGPPTEVKAGRASKAVVARAREAAARLAEVAALPEARRAEAMAALELVRSDAAMEVLAEIPVDALRQTAEGAVRTGPLADAGYRTVADVARAQPSALVPLPGIGAQTADRAVRAARQAAERARSTAPVRLDAGRPTAAGTVLLAAIRRWDAVRRLHATHGEAAGALAARLVGLAEAAAPAGSRIGMLFRGRSKQVALDSAGQLAAALAAPETSALLAAVGAAVAPPELGPAELWADYERRAADVSALLADLGAGPPVAAGHGHVPDEIVATVEALELDLSLLDPGLHLRGYQRFGAQFAVVQGRTILGDEMGLGKTIEALAVMAHLAATGARHFVVICPAAVVVNWTREIGSRTRLTPVKLHGSGREDALRRWEADGGVAVTTFATASTLEIPPEVRPGLLVVDECHYVKNPSTRRTRAVKAWGAASTRVLYMSGTPMENRVAEFKELVSHLQPELAAGLPLDAGLLGADAFRQAVAPVYLRRNQEDVLTELPQRIDSEDWVEMEGADLDAYRAAVAGGSFMAMRRAAFVPGTVEGSAKLDALVDLCDEAAEEGLKVVVFSFFLDVLTVVGAALGERALGPLTGALPPPERQGLLDEFTAAPGHVVLVSQIEAGGVGLNMQAGSVVVLCEPQWKPSTEEQAIARCHRMGQVRRVQVHRLLAEASVDEHMVQIVRAKGALIDGLVGTSATAQASPAATDASTAAPDGAEGLSEAEAERRIIDAERRRLGLAPVDAPGPDEGDEGGAPAGDIVPGRAAEVADAEPNPDAAGSDLETCAGAAAPPTGPDGFGSDGRQGSGL